MKKTSYSKLRAAIADTGLCERITSETGLPSSFAVTSSLNTRESVGYDIAWLDPGVYLTVRVDTPEDVEKLDKLLTQPSGTLRERVLAVAAEVAEVAEQDGIGKDLAEYYSTMAGAVSASLDYASAAKEANALHDEIERLQKRFSALAAGLDLHDHPCRWRG